MMREPADLSAAWAWLDALALTLPSETLAGADCCGRVLAEPVLAEADRPPVACAAIDGFALLAADSEGAGGYNPLPIRLAPILAGAALPAGTDAVLPADLVQGGLALAQAASGEGVAAARSEMTQGALLLPAGHVLRPWDLPSLGGSVAVRRRLRVRLELRGAKPPAADRLAGMLQALLAADNAAIAEPSDLLVVVGRSGIGDDDDSAARLTAAGCVWTWHGIAMRPGGTAGLGMLGTLPVLLLPGEPVAAALCWDVLVRRLLRRLAGLPMPRQCACRLASRVVSAIGQADILRVAVSGDLAMPWPSVEGGGGGGLRAADGYVIVPEGREGLAAGDLVTVTLFEA